MFAAVLFNINVSATSESSYSRQYVELMGKYSNVILVDNENYLPNILKRLWRLFSRDEIYQPNRYQLEISGNYLELESLVVDDPHSNLQRRIYDAVFRILPEGFKIIKDL